MCPSQGQRHLGAVLGSRVYFEDYVNGRVEEWVSKVAKLSEFAATELQAPLYRLHVWS